jgi:hypothetical protein
MLGVVEVCPVQGLALPLVDRPRVAVPKALELGGGPSNLPPPFPAASSIAVISPVAGSSRVMVPTLPL